VTVFENDTAEGYSHSDTLSGNFTIDNTNPLVYDLIPVAGQTFNATNTIEISANVTDNLGVDKVFANITCENGSSLLLELNNVLGDKYNNSFTIPNGECDGLYNISFIANDSAGNINNTEKTNFTAREHVAPEIQFDSTSTETGNYSQNYIFANVTASDANLDRVVIYLYNSMGLVESVSNNGNFSNNFTGLLDGTYYLNATANDTSLNINQTETRIILLDTVIPEIDFFSDTVDSENIIEDYIFVNISATDENLDTITIYLYNSTSLVGAIEDSSSFNFTNLPIENYYFNATINDSAGNLNYTETRQVNIVEPAYSDNISIMDSSGNPLNVSFTILNPNNEIIYSDMGMSHIEGLVPGIYDVIITPQDNYFKEIRIDGINWTENMTELISLENPVENQGYNQLVSFNPTLNGNSIIENVTNMTMNFTASNVSGNRILYKCGEWNFTNHTCFGEWIPIRGILPGENYTFFTDNLTDPALAEGNGTFFEGFEGGESDNQANIGYDNVNWTIVGGGTWNPNEKDEFAGADALSVKGNTTGFAWNEINISTEGYSNIVLSVYYENQGGFEGNDFLSLDWYNGTDWINELNVSTDIGTYTLFNSTLASESENNPNFKIRLGCNVDAANEYCLWDNVQISALEITDTCTYSGSGNWEINCSDNCVIDSNVDLLGNNISIIGFGNFTTIANITNWNDLFIEGDSSANRCEVYCANGGCFK